MSNILICYTLKPTFHMKTRILLLSFMTFVSINIVAQSDYSSYLDDAMSKIKAGECESARKYYNVYKEMSGKSSPSVEALLIDCENSAVKTDSNRHYINEKIKIGEFLYRVAYVEDEGQHGFAIYDYGSSKLTSKLIKNRLVPTRSEMQIISSNAHLLNLKTKLYYWTLDKRDNDCGSRYFIVELSTLDTKYDYTTNYNSLLLIHRF